MSLDLTQLNILGNKFTALGDFILVLAAIEEANIDSQNSDDGNQSESKSENSASKSETNQDNNSFEADEATRLNILGNWLVLIGDFLQAIILQIEVIKTKEENDGEIPRATRLDLLGSWLVVAGDLLAVEAAIEEAEEDNNS